MCGQAAVYQWNKMEGRRERKKGRIAERKEEQREQEEKNWKKRG